MTSHGNIQSYGADATHAPQPGLETTSKAKILSQLGVIT